MLPSLWEDRSIRADNKEGVDYVILLEDVSVLTLTPPPLSLSLSHTHTHTHPMHVLLASCLPFIPDKGTVGASGDLAPLSHLALGMMGEGNMWCPESGWGQAKDILHAHQLKPISLQAKEVHEYRYMYFKFRLRNYRFVIISWQ